MFVDDQQESEMSGQTAPPWVTLGLKDLGFHETGDNQGIEEFISQAHCGQLGDPWCAIWANAKLEQAKIDGTRSASSQSFRHNPNFVPLDGPALGAIAVYWRQSKDSGLGHVGFYMGETDTQVLTLGGNESDAVRQQFEPKSQLFGYWWPKLVPAPTIGPIKVDAKDGHPVGSVT
jgi:uncharacterized protein (TIGR02594 family)